MIVVDMFYCQSRLVREAVRIRLLKMAVYVARRAKPQGIPLKLDFAVLDRCMGFDPTGMKKLN
jgi:hypothetical protein